jgi:phenylacetate-coenzyme A ligase PaaK-like adenylate-forming protein
MSGWVDKAYQASPVWLQQLGITAFGWQWGRRRFGGEFERISRAYVERESWPADRMREYVESQLRRQVQRAYAEVPHYQRAFRDAGVSEETIRHFKSSDLGKLPLLEKPFLRTSPRVLLTETAARHSPKMFHSSGSTGAPIPVFMDPAMHQHTIAVREARSFRWARVSYRESRCTLGGRLIISPSQKRPPYWRYNPWERQLYLSAHRMSEETVADYVAALNRFKPPTLIGYATAIYVFAKLMDKLHLKVLHRPRAIITTAERLEPYMRKVIESVFGVRVYEEYGSAENVALATECEQGNLHMHVDFGFVEILRPDGRPAAAGELGEMVISGFANLNQIFIRYRIGDWASWSPEACPCGRDSLPTIGDLVGRVEDIAIAPDGRQIVRMYYIFQDIPAVLEGQIIQEGLCRFVFNVVPGPGYSRAAALSKIREVFEKRFALGTEVEVEIRELEAIPRGPNGKFRSIINRALS